MRPRSLVQSHYEPVTFTLVQGHDPTLTPFIQFTNRRPGQVPQMSQGRMFPLLKKTKNKNKKTTLLIPQHTDARKEHHIHTPHSLTLNAFPSSFSTQNKFPHPPWPINSEFSSFPKPTENTDHLLRRYAVVSFYLRRVCLFFLVACKHLKKQGLGHLSCAACYSLVLSNMHCIQQALYLWLVAH